MIPNNINRNDILRAINEVDTNSFSPDRKSKIYDLVFNGKFYPPKYIISLGNKYANGRELDPSEYSGGSESNNFLVRLGFEIVNKTNNNFVSKRAKQKISNHNERCSDCKNVIIEILRKIYGNIKIDYKFEISARLDDYKNKIYYPDLKNIYERLIEYRGYKNFIRLNKLHRCDIYIPNPSFIVELDESQHFSQARLISLENYPDNLILGYNKDQWKELCRNKQAKDNDPEFRDEQRAWYDTIRDFLPLINQFAPTVRIYMGEKKWCELDPNNQKDQQMFQDFINFKSKKVNTTETKIEVLSDRNPDLARLVIAGRWTGDVSEAGAVLSETIQKWPDGKRVKFFITPAAFIQFDWHEEMFANIDDAKFPPQGKTEVIYKHAETYLNRLLNEKLVSDLQKLTDYLTIGIDSFKKKISLSSVQIRKPHVELVALIRLKDKKVFWTGKSYPTTGQQDGLIRITDIKSHYITTEYGTIMVLGCHDLNVFSPRGAAVTKIGWRKDTRDQMIVMAQKEKPAIVLHHPHTTDSCKIWTAAWNELIRRVPSVQLYIASGRYYREKGERSSLESVLKNTKKCQSIDFIYRSKTANLSV